MVSVLLNFWISFIAGIFAPLVAICVLPLYPAFLTYLSGQTKAETKTSTFAWIVTAGIIVSMLIVGLIFSFILKKSLTQAIGIISPIAFIILAIISLFLIFNFNFSKFFPRFNIPTTKNPFLTSFIFGLFFGIIVLPCNPASLVVLFAISTSTTEFLINLTNFILFGIGMGLPLLIFGYASDKAHGIIQFIINKKKIINLIAGLIMLAISMYYLIFVFRIFG